MGQKKIRELVPRMAEKIPRYPGIHMPIYPRWNRRHSDTHYPGWKRRHSDTKIFSREDTQVSMCEETQDGRRVKGSFQKHLSK